VTRRAEGSERRAIFITGAASGMGRATARLFADKGWLAGAYDVDEKGLASLQRELGADRCVVRRLDVTDKADYDRAVSEFGTATGGRMDILFNNAGIGVGGWFDEIPYEDAMRIVAVNFVGVVNGIYAALPLLKNTPGSLCFSTSSSSATYGMPRLAMYAATKFAIKGLTEALSIEFERHGVRVADVLPGIIDTPILDTPIAAGEGGRRSRTIRDAATPDGAFRLLPPESVAECVWEAYGSDRLHWYVPAEVEALDRARAAGAEGLREQIRKSMGAASVGGS
jgi:NAD(P)-dependent dehydrogenase (short-subunit alcohol dehydrogenase family)